MLTDGSMPEVRSKREPRFTRTCTAGHARVRDRPQLLLLSALILGCSGHDDSSSSQAERRFEPLVELEAWTAVARSEDPFLDPRTPPADCATPGARVESAQNWLELDTSVCGFITVAADARFAVAEGAKVRLDLSHFDLDAATPTSAELRLRFGNCSAWETSLEIPAPAQVHGLEFDSECEVASGGQVWFHLHNHGQNTYQLRGLSVLR